jgi:hypothetical protein
MAWFQGTILCPLRWIGNKRHLSPPVVPAGGLRSLQNRKTSRRAFYPLAFTVSKPLKRWLLGEGDTIFHLNGKKVTHSPGTEDEYGSCWDFGNTYSYLDSGYLENDKGQNRMYRWYLTNPVRFRESLKVEIQNQHNNGTPTTDDADDYTSIAYWYQDGPHSTPLQAFAERTAASKAGAGKKRK